MSRHESSGLEILLGLLFAGALFSGKVTLFLIRTARNLASESKASRAEGQR